MIPFLAGVAKEILEDQSYPLHSVCVITPNNRAGLFLKKYMAETITQPVWAPDILSMDQFARRISEFNVPETIELLIEFYHIYQKVEKDYAETTDEFIKWAPLLLHDFNEIDSSCKNPSEIFDNITAAKRIEAWNPDGKPPTEFQQRFLAFFKKFKTWHQNLTSHLEENKMGYKGLAYRVAAEKLSNNDGTLPWKKIYIVGFNALNEAEQSILTELKRQVDVRFLWDGDKYYVDNPGHEAGYFLRKNLKKWGSAGGWQLGDHFTMAAKRINVLGVTRNVSQAKLAASILADLSSAEFVNNQTALILANEDLLLPVLHSIPDNIPQLNVTMGLPLRKTPLYGLVDAFFQLHLTTERLKLVKDDKRSAFYFRDIIRIIRHPVISALMEQISTPLNSSQLVRKIYQSRNTFLYFSSIKNMVSEHEGFANLLDRLFDIKGLMPLGFIDALGGFLDNLLLSDETDVNHQKSGLGLANDITRGEAIMQLQKLVRKVRNHLSGNPALTNLRIVYMLFQSMARETKIVLKGEPLAGLQIMGMLETQSLDFKNIIILSANEGILPAGKSNSSLIPFDIRLGFGIPVNRDKDAVYAYHFYRLLQRAQNIWLVYNTQAQDLGSSEKSRFITQLEMELPAWDPTTKITHSIISSSIDHTGYDDEIAVTKTPEVFEKLDRINQKGFSPSTLSHYIQCSLLFYFRHIAGIKEPDEPEEIIQANTLGTVVHQVLENLYRSEQCDGKMLDKQIIERLIPKIAPFVKEAFEKIYSGGDITMGKNLLLSKVAIRYVRNYLLFEKKFLDELETRGSGLRYLNSEQVMEAETEILVGDKKRKIKLRGFADRIDKLDNIIRILDYKSGAVQPTDLTVKNWDDLITLPKYGKSFQLLMYALIHQLINPSETTLIPGIISLRKPSNGVMSPKLPGQSQPGINHYDLALFKEKLSGLINDIFDPKKPFHRTEDEKNCRNCEFRSVCNR